MLKSKFEPNCIIFNMSILYGRGILVNEILYQNPKTAAE